MIKKIKIKKSSRWRSFVALSVKRMLVAATVVLMVGWCCSCWKVGRVRRWAVVRHGDVAKMTVGRCHWYPKSKKIVERKK